MPIVLSYEDVSALGALAYKSGFTPGYARGAEQAADRSSRAAEASARYRLAQDELRMRQQETQAGRSFQAQQAELDRTFRGQQGELDRGFTRERDVFSATLQNQRLATELAARERETQAQLQARQQQTEAEAAAAVQRELLEAELQRQRDQRLHDQRMRQTEREAELGRWSGRSSSRPATLSPQGVPTERFAEDEALRFGHLVPFNAGRAVSADMASRGRKRAAETAVELASLPTAEIEAYLNARPRDPWAPYLRAIVESRRQNTAGAATDAPSGPRQSAMAEGRRLPTTHHAAPRSGLTAPVGAAGGYRGQSLLQGLSDEDLYRAAQDPALLNRLLGQ